AGKQWSQVEVRGGETVTKSMRVRASALPEGFGDPSGTLVVAVRANGEGVAEEVVVVLDEGGALVASGTTDPDGLAPFELPGGRYTVAADDAEAAANVALGITTSVTLQVVDQRR